MRRTKIEQSMRAMTRAFITCYAGLRDCDRSERVPQCSENNLERWCARDKKLRCNADDAGMNISAAKREVHTNDIRCSGRRRRSRL